MNHIARLMMALLLGAGLNGATLADVTMPDTLTVEGQTLVLNGMALRKKVVFKVYVDGLYLPQKEKSAERILQNDQMRHNVLHFKRSVGKDSLVGAWNDGLEANVPQAGGELKKQFALLGEWMEDVAEDDTMSFTYVPGSGTRVQVKGKLKGTIEGKPFADALFSCWIGAKPGPGEKFKQALLGN